jgi:hypothetical protein
MTNFVRSGHITTWRAPKGAPPISKKKSQSVNLNRDLVRTAVTYRSKVGIWQELLNKKLVVIPRESKALYREGWLLVRGGIALIELDTPTTLYLRISPGDLTRRKLLFALNAKGKDAVRSPALLDNDLF